MIEASENNEIRLIKPKILINFATHEIFIYRPSLEYSKLFIIKGVHFTFELGADASFYLIFSTWQRNGHLPRFVNLEFPYFRLCASALIFALNLFNLIHGKRIANRVVFHGNKVSEQRVFIIVIESLIQKLIDLGLVFRSFTSIDSISCSSISCSSKKFPMKPPGGIWRVFIPPS